MKNIYVYIDKKLVTMILRQRLLKEQMDTVNIKIT